MEFLNYALGIGILIFAVSFFIFVVTYASDPFMQAWNEYKTNENKAIQAMIKHMHDSLIETQTELNNLKDKIKKMENDSSTTKQDKS